MIQALRYIEISKYDGGGQLMTAAKLCLEAVYLAWIDKYFNIDKQYQH